jgi:hypothetical protein
MSASVSGENEPAQGCFPSSDSHPEVGLGTDLGKLRSEKTASFYRRRQ